MDEQIRQTLESHREILTERCLAAIEKDRTQENGISDTDVYLPNYDAFVALVLEHISLNANRNQEKVRDFANDQMQRGFHLHPLISALVSSKQAIIDFLINDRQMDAQKTLRSVQRWMDTITIQFVHEFTGSWEHTDSLQKMALKELSAPLVPVFDDISVMPLVGTIDTQRARLIMENLLAGVIKYESVVVLIDITGVPIVDTMVAQHLIKASEAVRLIGANCVLVGIRPEIAQTIVNLGINLSEFPTTSSLQKGVELALTMTKRKIIKVEQ